MLVCVLIIIFLSDYNLNLISRFFYFIMLVTLVTDERCYKLLFKIIESVNYLIVL